MIEYTRSILDPWFFYPDFCKKHQKTIIYHFIGAIFINTVVVWRDRDTLESIHMIAYDLDWNWWSPDWRNSHSEIKGVSQGPIRAQGNRPITSTTFYSWNDCRTHKLWNYDCISVKKSFILDGWEYNIIEIGMSLQIIISITLWSTV